VFSDFEIFLESGHQTIKINQVCLTAFPVKYNKIDYSIDSSLQPIF